MLQNIKGIKKKCTLEIPGYQREYKWSVENVKELYEYMISNETDKIYLGNMTFHYKEGEENVYITDGQQRITTLFLISIVLNKQSDDILGFYKDNSEYLFKFNNETIGEFDSSLKKLFDNKEIQIPIESKVDPYRQLPRINEVLSEFNKYIASKEKKQLLEEIDRFSDALNIKEVSCIITNDDSVDNIFLGINEKGLKLDQEDIYKASYISKFPIKKKKDAKERYVEIKKIFFEIFPSSDDDIIKKIIRPYYIYKNKKYVKENLKYSDGEYILDTISNSGDMEKELKEIKEMLENLKKFKGKTEGFAKFEKFIHYCLFNPLNEDMYIRLLKFKIYDKDDNYENIGKMIIKKALIGKTSISNFDNNINSYFDDFKYSDPAISLNEKKLGYVQCYIDLKDKVIADNDIENFFCDSKVYNKEHFLILNNGKIKKNDGQELEIPEGLMKNKNKIPNIFKLEKKLNGTLGNYIFSKKAKLYNKKYKQKGLLGRYIANLQSSKVIDEETSEKYFKSIEGLTRQHLDNIIIKEFFK